MVVRALPSPHTDGSYTWAGAEALLQQPREELSQGAPMSPYLGVPPALYLCPSLCLLVMAFDGLMAPGMGLGEAWAGCSLGLPTHHPLCDT